MKTMRALYIYSHISSNFSWIEADIFTGGIVIIDG